MKYLAVRCLPRRQRRAPHGARGLKYDVLERAREKVLVAPRTGRVD